MVCESSLRKMRKRPVTVGVRGAPVDTAARRTSTSPSYATRVWVERSMSIHFSPRTGCGVGGMAVGDGVQVGGGIGVGVYVGVAVLVGVGVCVTVGVAVLVGVDVAVAVAVAVGVGVKVGVAVAVGVGVGGKRNPRRFSMLPVTAKAPKTRESDTMISRRPGNR